ncbi:hypothetical protein MtrunA17_Chr4g0023421 [Medicago truncatula]|uniref:Uncharacterized protein n=1 Tax=Medicago truncatula TaxID=3880 RepID=A0A396I7K0_MEDTR|nr:hypothetical protein MtrunA17_Chr4g0023421 [Medicago truncatula]
MYPRGTCVHPLYFGFSPTCAAKMQSLIYRNKVNRTLETKTCKS